MFFIKLAFWLGVIVLLLPSDAQQQARLYGTATAVVERASTFCDRNAQTCAKAAEAWATFLKKAEFGARLVGDLVSSAGRQGADVLPSGPQPTRFGGRAETHGTLSPADMQPAWRNPAGRRAGA
ncbi:MAG: DUF5330 domain-containing protein [Hyphomonadaceae bacterium]|nr:DUF5330 domain-containing protein [Hyphomonadaceae bacterium]